MPIQQHTHIRAGNAKLCRYLVVCDFVDVHLAGIRVVGSEATAFQIELPEKLTIGEPTLREAIDAAAKKYPPVRM